MPRPSTARLVLVAVAVGGAGLAAHPVRRSLTRGWLEPGPRGALRCGETGSSPARLPGRGQRIAPRVRVVLVDGLGERAAQLLPSWQRVCRLGLRLQVDVGFPSVSLPVQHALWTGTWQSQSGVMYVVRQLARPVFPTLLESPSRCGRERGRAVAVADAYREIVDSFPFDRIVAPPAQGPAMPPARLRQAILREAAGEAELVLVHLLGVDKAGHRHGAASAAYREQARRADGLVGALWHVREPGWTVALLSDHGHLDLGGHGGLEPEVRWVEACLAGPGLAAGGRARATVVDLTRILADQLDVLPPACCQGRPLQQVLRGGALPRQPLAAARPAHAISGMAIAAALALLWLWFARVGQAKATARNVALALPWPAALASLLVLLWLGPPSLSRAYVYPAMPHVQLWPALGALAVGCWLQLWLLARRQALDLARSGLAAAAAALVPAAILLGLVGWPARQPALVPWLSAWAALALIMATVALCSIAAGVLGAAMASRGRDRGDRSSSPVTSKGSAGRSTPDTRVARGGLLDE